MNFLKLLLPIVALVGLLDASYLTYEKVAGLTPTCRPPFDCGTVLASPYAWIGPVPLSVLGMLFYATVLVVASLQFLDKKHLMIAGKLIAIPSLLHALTIFGFLFSLYLLTIMGVILNAWCLFCLISALTSMTLFVLMTIFWYRLDEATNRSLYPLKLALFGMLYEQVLKRLFFLFNPEFIHHRMVEAGTLLGINPLTRWLTRTLFLYQDPRAARTIAGIQFQNPVGLSAGFDYDADLAQILPDVGYGFMTVGTVTRYPYEGNTRPMLTRFPDSNALLVNKGFKSMGAEAVIEKLTGKTFRIPVGISIGSTNRVYEHVDDQIQDIVESFTLFEQSSVKHAYYELNISCPNTKGGQPFTDTVRFTKLVKALTKLRLQKPVFLKMPIDLADNMSTKQTQAKLLDILQIAARTKWITGVICGNLTKDHENPALTAKDRALWKSMKGGISGKPTFERSNALIRLVKKNFKSRFVIIGTGGIFSGEDALAKINAGADLVQLITGMIYQGPQLISEITWTVAQKTR